MTSKNQDSSTSSWRGIKQSASRKAVTSIARRRRLVVFARNMGITSALLLFLGLISYSIYWVRQSQVELKVMGPSAPLAGYIWQSDGVLTQRWFEEQLAPPLGTPIMDVDIFELRKQMLNYGQIAKVSVSRQFPDKIAIELEERIPLLRARVGIPGGGYQDLLVADDGHIYTAYDYPRARLARLPYLGGVRFERLDERSLKPVSGIETIKALLAISQELFPELAKTWGVIDCRDFSGDAEDPYAVIRVKSRHVKEIIFRPKHFAEQLAKLKQILEYAEARGHEVIPRVDLRMDEPVVQLTASTDKSKRAF